jgi:site-specific DNA recombinase
MSIIRYCLYVRKSSEQDERQAMSIESQRREMKKVQESEELDVVKIIEESKSAKESFSRPGFTRLMEGVRDGEYEGVLTWAVDRLSRNAGDLGLLVDLMDQEKLKVVRTHDRTFLGESPSEKFLLMLLGSQAKLENENRAENVKRGMRSACSQGRRPYGTPIGYKIIPGEAIQDHNRVVIDGEWAPFVQDVFNMVGERCLSVYQVWKKLGQCGQLTKNGKPFSKSSLQHILAETFYYGDFEYPKKSGNWYKGKHEAIITKEIYDKVQENIAKRRPKQPRRKWGEVPFKFNRIFKCGECGSGINGIFRQNRYNRLYLYYKCNKACSTIKCKQHHIRGQALVEQIGSIAKKITEADIGKLNERQKESIDRYSRIMNESIHPYWLIKTELMNGDLQEKADALRSLKGKLLITDKKMIYEAMKS